MAFTSEHKYAPHMIVFGYFHCLPYGEHIRRQSSCRTDLHGSDDGISIRSYDHARAARKRVTPEKAALRHFFPGSEQIAPESLP